MVIISPLFLSALRVYYMHYIECNSAVKFHKTGKNQIEGHFSAYTYMHATFFSKIPFCIKLEKNSVFLNSFLYSAEKIIKCSEPMGWNFKIYFIKGVSLSMTKIACLLQQRDIEVMNRNSDLRWTQLKPHFLTHYSPSLWSGRILPWGLLVWKHRRQQHHCLMEFLWG